MADSSPGRVKRAIASLQAIRVAGEVKHFQLAGGAEVS